MDAPVKLGKFNQENSEHTFVQQLEAREIGPIKVLEEQWLAV